MLLCSTVWALLILLQVVVFCLSLSMFRGLVFHCHSLRWTKNWINVLWDHFYSLLSVHLVFLLRFDTDVLWLELWVYVDHYWFQHSNNLNNYWWLFMLDEGPWHFLHSLFYTLYLMWQFGSIFQGHWVSGIVFPTGGFWDELYVYHLERVVLFEL